MSQDFEFQLLASGHDRAAFDCANPSLTDYLRKYASQEMRRNVAAVYILVHTGDAKRVVGYYTLSSTSIPLGNFPEEIAKKLPRYPNIPATLLGRLAVNVGDQKQGHGARLLTDALHRSLLLSNSIASAAVVVDAIDSDAESFYKRFGFLPLADDPMHLFIPMGSVKLSFTLKT